MIDFSVLRHGRRLDMVQKAQMSSGPTGGENTLYYVLVGATFLGAGVYVSTHLLWILHQPHIDNTMNIYFKHSCFNFY